MRPGRRDEKILVQEPIEIENEYGEPEIKWVEFSKPWAGISPEKGREYFAAQQINNYNPIAITVNYNKLLSDKFRVIYEDRIYEIKNIAQFRKRNESKLICSEIT